MEFYNYATEALPKLVMVFSIFGIIGLGLLALAVLINTDMPGFALPILILAAFLGLVAAADFKKTYKYVSESPIAKIDLKSKIVVIDTAESNVAIISQTDQMALLRNPNCRVIRYSTTNHFGWKFGVAALIDTAVISGSR
jgi:hypothetical protein